MLLGEEALGGQGWKQGDRLGDDFLQSVIRGGDDAGLMESGRVGPKSNGRMLGVSFAL